MVGEGHGGAKRIKIAIPPVDFVSFSPIEAPPAHVPVIFQDFGIIRACKACRFATLTGRLGLICCGDMAPPVGVDLTRWRLQPGQERRIDPRRIPRDAMEDHDINVVWILICK